MSWTEFLDEVNEKKVEALKDGVTTDAWVYFWDEQTIQLDGDFKLSDLKCIIAMMESFESKTGTAAPDPEAPSNPPSPK